MSLILDALRKSEAERRRGQAPSLFSSVATPPPSRVAEALRFWPVLVFVALVMVAGWIVWRAEDSAGTTASGPAPGNAPMNPPVIAADAHADAAVVSNTEPLRPVATPPSSEPTIVAAPAPAPAPAPASVGAPPPRATAASSAPEPPKAPQPLPARPVQTAIPPPPVSTPPLTEASAPPRTEELAPEPLPPIAVLSPSERAGLPPLKLSMHVFGSEPGKRFAIIDGQRVTEGSVLGSSVVEAIRRDGVVLNINGRRILLPRP